MMSFVYPPCNINVITNQPFLSSCCRPYRALLVPLFSKPHIPNAWEKCIERQGALEDAVAFANL